MYVPRGSESCADQHNSGDVLRNPRSSEQGHVGGQKDSGHLETVHFQFRGCLGSWVGLVMPFVKTWARWGSLLGSGMIEIRVHFICNEVKLQLKKIPL